MRRIFLYLCLVVILCDGVSLDAKDLSLSRLVVSFCLRFNSYCMSIYLRSKLSASEMTLDALTMIVVLYAFSKLLGIFPRMTADFACHSHLHALTTWILRSLRFHVKLLKENPVFRYFV